MSVAGSIWIRRPSGDAHTSPVGWKPMWCAQDEQLAMRARFLSEAQQTCLCGPLSLASWPNSAERQYDCDVDVRPVLIF
jgi:hypothetical protein